MAGRDLENGFFKDSRRDWISDRATRRDDVDPTRRPRSRERDRSPLERGGPDYPWNSDRYSRGKPERDDGDSRRRRSPERSRSIKSSPERRHYHDDGRDNFGSRTDDSAYGGYRDREKRESSSKSSSYYRDSRDPSRYSPRRSPDSRSAYRRSRSRERDRGMSSADRLDKFGRCISRGRDRISEEKSSRVESSLSPRGRAGASESKVDNWGRELRLGGNCSPDRFDRNIRSDSRKRERSVERSRGRRSRDRDWKRSVEDFLDHKGSRSNSPRRRNSRDRSTRDGGSGRHTQTEEEWDREIKRFERDRMTYHRSRSSPKRGRSIDSPKPVRSRGCTPVVDEKCDGEDMVISDDDNNEDSKQSNDDWESIAHMKYKGDNSSNGKFDYKVSTPQKTIVVMGMPPSVTEFDIHEDITASHLVCHDIRLVRKFTKGFSKGFAFVEFYNVDDAVSWMGKKQGSVMLGNVKCCMEYSLPRDVRQTRQSTQKNPLHLTDWKCSKCQAHNFSKRFLCFVCGASRTEADNDNDVQTSDRPTTTVVLLGLDALTTEETVLKSIASLSNFPILSVKIARDPLTSISQGACYLEMNNVLDAFNLFNALKGTINEIDGKTPEIKYAVTTSNQSPAISILPKSVTGMGKLGSAAVAAAQWSHQSSKSSSDQYTLADVPKLAEYSAALYAKTPQDKIGYYNYYVDYYKKQITEGGPVYLPVDSANGLATAQAALAASKSAAPTITSLTEPPDGSGTHTYPEPDTSQYQYDPSSGFYYDPFTKLYYDGNSHYYYNSKLQKYLYWDGTQRTYLPTPSSAELPEMSGTTSQHVIIGAPQAASKPQEKKKEKEGDADRVKIAKKIAKDMEKWAKTLNQKKETAKQNTVTPPGGVPTSSRFGSTSGAADIGFAVLERKDHLSTLGNYYSPVPARNEMLTSAIAPAAMESDDEDEAAEDRSHTDWDKLICLLCKRQLGSKEALVKHQQMSDLHKQNLSAWYQARGLDPDDALKRKNQYRDRASERRQKYGLPDVPKPNRLKESYMKSRETSYEQPTTAKGIGADNLGNKLLQKMGWQEGMGLGKSNQGRTSIIEAKSRSATAGLGSRAAGIAPGPGETYKDCVRKMMAVRYAQLED